MEEGRKNDTWAIAELMGHLTLAGRITKPGDYGGLWQIDIPEGETFRTEFFANGSVYRIRIVSEEIARAYARPGHQMIEYSAPIVTREEHESSVRRYQEELQRLQRANSILQQRLTAIEEGMPQLPIGSSYGDPGPGDYDDEEPDF